MGSLDGEDGSIDDGLVALLVEAQAGDLWEEVVKPRAGTRVTMCACHSHIVFGVDRILGAQGTKTFQDAVADGCVAGLGVQHHVDDSLAGSIGTAHDEGAGVQSLAEARSYLRRVGIAHQVELNYRAGEVSVLIRT